MVYKIKLTNYALSTGALLHDDAKGQMSNLQVLKTVILLLLAEDRLLLTSLKIYSQIVY